VLLQQLRNFFFLATNATQSQLADIYLSPKETINFPLESLVFAETGRPIANVSHMLCVLDQQT